MEYEASGKNQIEEWENKRREFERVLDEALAEKEGEEVPVIEYDLPYPKEEFLKFLVEEKNVLLHGSPNADLEILEPRRANDAAKESGNKEAVYAVTDPVLAIFHAIQDREKIDGAVESETRDNSETGEQEYKFSMPKRSLESEPWKTGMIYIFNKDDFKPEEDGGELSGEWTSEEEVKSIAKIEVRPDDFSYIDEVEGVE